MVHSSDYCDCEAIEPIRHCSKTDVSNFLSLYILIFLFYRYIPLSAKCRKSPFWTMFRDFSPISPMVQKTSELIWEKYNKQINSLYTLIISKVLTETILLEDQVQISGNNYSADSTTIYRKSGTHGPNSKGCPSGTH